MAQFTRRKFLEVLAVSASATALSGCPLGDRDNGGKYIQLAPEFFPQSVASGDPRDSSVILWTRIQVKANDTADRKLLLQVATDNLFEHVVVSSEFTAKSDNDHCLKVRVTGLTAGTTYFYRFVYRADQSYRSRTGTTKTAPASSSTNAVKFATVSCQDFIGRYFNPYVMMATLDLDFVIHLGDYIYETTGDPRFQSSTSARKISFSDTAGAVKLGTEAAPFYAAQSLSNYRELYKQYRNDSALQAVHEKFPFICIWDDHEFADDSWSDTATAFNGRVNETSATRKQNAERAYFDYMPIDYSPAADTAALEVQDADLFPNTTIYRDFHFGANVHLAMTDYRSHRPDHIVPEEAFPGLVAVDEATVRAALGISDDAVWSVAKAKFNPYIDFSSATSVGVLPAAAYQPVIAGALTQYYVSKGDTPEAAAARGQALKAAKLNAALAKQLVDAAIAAGAPVPPIDAAVFATLPRGVDLTMVGKTGVFGEVGSRYFVVKPTYDLIAGVKAAATAGAAQNAYGDAQTAWLMGTLGGSAARWKFLGSSVSMTSMVLDLSTPGLGVPAPFNQQFYLNVDQWDGFPNARKNLIDAMDAMPGAVVILSGDIHASYATQHRDNVVEVTGTSMSSGTLQALLRTTVAGDATLSSVPNIDLLVANVDAFITGANPSIKYTTSKVNGFTTVTAMADSCDVNYYEWNEYAALTSNYAAPGTVVNTAVVKKFEINSDNQFGPKV